MLIKTLRMENFRQFRGTTDVAFSCDPQKNVTITEVATLIREGANTFMSREYKILATFAAVVAVLIFVFLPAPIWKGGIADNLSMPLHILQVLCCLLLPVRSACWSPAYPTDAQQKLQAKALSRHSLSASEAVP